jgi:hypothetical protein
LGYSRSGFEPVNCRFHAASMLGVKSEIENGKEAQLFPGRSLTFNASSSAPR